MADTTRNNCCARRGLARTLLPGLVAALFLLLAPASAHATSHKAEARETLHEYFEALRRGDYELACSLTTRRSRGADAQCPNAMREAWTLASKQMLTRLRNEARRAPVRRRRHRLVVDLRDARGGGPRMLVRHERGRYRVDGQLDFLW